MTDVQWIFHYLETVAAEKEKSKYEFNLIEILFKVLKNNTDLITAYINPQIYRKMNQDLQKEAMFSSDDIGKENIATVPTDQEQEIMDKYSSFVSQFPEELFVEDNSRNKLVPKITKEELFQKIAIGINKYKE